MTGETLNGDEVVLTVDAYRDEIEAFNMVGADVVRQAIERGWIKFDEGQVRDAIDTLNIIASRVGDDENDPLYAKLGYIVELHQTEKFKNTFSFGIEAVCKDGQVSIWWPQ